MPPKILLYSLVILFCNCHNNQSEIKKYSPALTTDNGEFALDPIEQRFTLSYPENLQSDSNSLIFYRTSSFDTSLLIHFYKTKNAVKVVCYETLPTYHRNINDYADKENHLLFFEGYSFIIDTIKWRSVKENAQKILADTNTRFRNDGCADCGFGLIAHDFKVRRTNNANRTLYDDYARWLKDSLLKQFVEKRKPIMRKKDTQ
jgi:hypothetical protein